MQKQQGLAKAAAVMVIITMLATMLLVNVNAPMPKRASRHTAAWQEIPAPRTAPKGGVKAAQGRGTAVERREAGGSRAPGDSSAGEQ